jgi:colanic acid biosynthesis glycosyl transferase WcaI
MKILIYTQYFPPESVGPAIWIDELVQDLAGRGHELKVLTAFPNHPGSEVFEDYRGKLFQREVEKGIEIYRSWIFPPKTRRFWQRVLSFLSFTISSCILGLARVRKVDVIYTTLQPLSLGPVAVWLGRKLGARIVLNIQDIHPYAAVQMGALRNPLLIRLLEGLERWNYRRADRVVVISEGFKENLLQKGVPEAKIEVVPNWADPDFIQPGPKLNQFREEQGLGEDFTVIYSGGLTHNSNLEPVIKAAEILHEEPYQFVIVGDGVRKPALVKMAQEKRLEKVQFLPFQPLENYPDVLRAADISLVTLSTQAAYASVPSKIFKQMASGRPVLAITAEGNEVDRMVREGKFGLQVPPDDPQALAEAIKWAASHPAELDKMGQRGRDYLRVNFSRDHCVKLIEAVLLESVGEDQK